jgi:replication fork protection complex subunit Csm3/Swi3
MDSIDNIWDASVQPPSPRRSSPEQAPESADSHEEPLPRARPRRPLFLESDDDDDVPPQTPAPATVVATDIDAMFASALEDENFESLPMPPPLDVGAIQRQAERRHALSLPTVLPGNASSSNVEAAKKRNETDALDGDEKKVRKKPAVLNEAKLLNTTHGFPRLIEMMKDFEPKGKGHEVK